PGAACLWIAWQSLRINPSRSPGDRFSSLPRPQQGAGEVGDVVESRTAGLVGLLRGRRRPARAGLAERLVLAGRDQLPGRRVLADVRHDAQRRVVGLVGVLYGAVGSPLGRGEEGDRRAVVVVVRVERAAVDRLEPGLLEVVERADPVAQ